MNPKASIKNQLATWLNQHGLFALSLFLLIFIPLYPKIPLLEAIPGYLVRVRLEDILVFITALVWLVQLLRKKINWQTSFHFLIIAYAGVGLLSLLIATTLQQTIPLQSIHLGKSLLHYFRYLEYFSLFLFLYAGIKTKRHLKISLFAILITLNLIFAYGIGQRHLSWPAFSTMNREYSKGQALVLAPNIKLHSTFGGHYDLAAYLVLILPILSAWLLHSKKRILQWWLGLSILGGGWLLLESASKTALMAALIAMAGVIWFSLYQRWGLIKSSLLSIGTGLALGGVAVASLWFLQRPTLYKLAPYLRPAAYQTPVDVETTLDETWSANAQKYGLSMGIRLDTLWPNSLSGFSLNPYTGKGYATLNKQGVNEFTEADSTDNNFLRVLGETGLLGLMTFFGLIVLIIKTLTLKLPSQPLPQALTVGFIAATAGLLINSLVIDVFAASKVAFTFWGLAGLALKSYLLDQTQLVKKQEAARLKKFASWFKKSWPILAAGIILMLLVHKRPFTEHSLVKSFALNSAQAKYVAAPKCWLNDCPLHYQLGLGQLYSLYLTPFLLIWSEPAMFYFANLILIIGSASLLNQLIQKLTNNQLFRFLLLTMIFICPNSYTLPTKSSPANLWLFLGLLLLNKLLPNIKPRPLPKLFNLALLGLLMIQLSFIQRFISLSGGVLASWRDAYRPTNYPAIRRANRYLSSNATPSILLTDIEPVLFDLYGTDGYQIAPIDETKIADYQQLLATQELFITNANAGDDFELYQQQFGIHLREIDCRQECNYYQLQAKEVVIPEYPLAFNKFLVISDQLVADIGSGYFTADKELLKQELIDQDPELIFITGDQDNEYFKHYGASFIKRLKPEIEVPIITTYEDEAQLFAVGESWYITLDAATHHGNPAQNVFLYDALLQLEKHPEVKNVYFISQDDQWLQPHPDNYYFWQDFPQALKKFEGRVEFKFRYEEELFSRANRF